MSLRELADASHHSKTNIGDWENGKLAPVGAAESLDVALRADGALAALVGEDGRQAQQQVVLRDSERLCGLLAEVGNGELVSRLDGRTERLAVEYLTRPGMAMVDEISAARRQAVTALRNRRLKGASQIRYLTADIGYLSGILSYAALDAGDPRGALAHADAAWEAANLAGSDQLKAWVRGTQSLILRFGQRFTEAQEHAEDGLRYADTGTARARLLAGVAQCRANVTDAVGTRRALANAETAFDEVDGTDEVDGLFTFSRAKLLYYSGSSLIWLHGGPDAEKARARAHEAIELWKRGGSDWSLADEALANVYSATASLQLRQLEQAATDLEPILSSAPESRVSWITKRMDRIVGMLGRPPYQDDRLARELVERIGTYA